MVFGFRFFNRNNKKKKKKKKKKNMDNLENNLLHVSHTLCIIISYFLRYNLHFAYSLPGHYYKSCCFHIESESCIFVMYRFNAEHPGQSLYTPTTVGVIIVCMRYVVSLVYMFIVFCGVKNICHRLNHENPLFWSRNSYDVLIWGSRLHNYACVQNFSPTHIFGC